MKTTAPEETRELGRRLAKKLKAGDVLLLWGDLGAGKSEFTRGLAQGLGVTATVTSPSFTILNVYDDGRIPLYHFDWYRMAWRWLSGPASALKPSRKRTLPSA